MDFEEQLPLLLSLAAFFCKSSTHHYKRQQQIHNIEILRLSARQ
jgi:hypothetical protein